MRPPPCLKKSVSTRLIRTQPKTDGNDDRRLDRLAVAPCRHETPMPDCGGRRVVEGFVAATLAHPDGNRDAFCGDADIEAYGAFEAAPTRDQRIARLGIVEVAGTEAWR